MSGAVFKNEIAEIFNARIEIKVLSTLRLQIALSPRKSLSLRVEIAV